MIRQYSNYVFLTESISTMGGSQLLVLRRAKYLQNLGISVKIIVQEHSEDFYLRDKFNNIPSLYVPELALPITLVSKRRKKELKKIVELFLSETSSCIIETHSLTTSVWGEYLSYLFNIKHIIYLLNESPINNFKYYPGKPFFEFKYQRGELYGCSNKSLELIFNKHEEGFDDSYINVSFDPLELTEFSDPPLKIDLNNNDVVISTVGRLNKGYIKPMILSCINYAIKNPQQHITLIVSGGTSNKLIEEKIKNEFVSTSKSITNLNIVFTGYIFSLGKDFFRMTDIFIGMGTASINAISQGCATINIDPRSNKASGIFGVDTNNFAYPEKNKLYKIEDKITELLNDANKLNAAKEKGLNLFNESFTNEASFNKLDYLLNRSDKNNLFFNFNINFLNKCKDLVLYSLVCFRKMIKHILLRISTN